MSDSEPEGAPGPEPASPPPDPPARPPLGGRFSTSVFVGLIAGGILLLAFTVAVLRKGERSLVPTLHPGEQVPPPDKGRVEAPSIVSPLGTVPHGSLTLHWVKAPGIDDYKAFVYDNRIQVIWSSGKVQGDSIAVPEPIAGRMIPGPAYFWRVVAIRNDGTEESSPTARFDLAP